MMNAVSVVLLLALISKGRTDETHWSHEHQETWPGVCNEGSQQSPLGVDQSTAHWEWFSEYHFQHFRTQLEGKVVNTGHSVAFRGTNLTNYTRPLISGGGLEHTYQFHELHFHWPSEHTVNDERYPLEMHLVTYQDKYSDLSEALNDPDGLAVFGVFFKISSDDSRYLSDLVSAVSNIEEANTEYELKEALELASFLPSNTENFYRYKGSLTTPDCQEVVVWTLFDQPLEISDAQYQQLTNIKDGEGKDLESNARYLQERNGRTIYKSFY